MSESDDTKEIPARQDPDSPLAPWRVHTDGSGEHCVIASDGQIVAITIPLFGERGSDDTRKRALCLAKAPEMHRLLTIGITRRFARDFNIHMWFAEIEALIERAE